MYRFFAFGKRLWVAMGMPMAPFVRHVRHRLLGKLWPAKHVYTPLVPTRQLQNKTKSPTITVVIQTEGKDLDRLERCVAALYNASGGVRIHPIIVVAPSTPVIERDILEHFGSRAKLLFCTARLHSYCVNLGLERKGDDDYVLLLQDDCFFTETHSLQHMVHTLQEHQWACIGPRAQYAEHPEHSEATTFTKPVPSTCVLWDASWIDRIGLFDGDTEYSWRARNLGARWGRDNAVEVIAEKHSYATPQKQWQPLPGVQVVIAGHNVSPWIQRALDSVERSMAGFHWILVFADDASTDDTLHIVQRHTTSAAHKIIRSFPKARGAAEAKNRAIALGTPYADEYPILCLMDSDDVLLPARMQLLLPHMHDHGHQVVFGAYEVASLKGYTKIQMPHADMQQQGEYLHPCSTLIHRSIVPADGMLFNPTLTQREDEDLWQQWQRSGIHMEPVIGPPVYRYIERENSVMRSGL